MTKKFKIVSLSSKVTVGTAKKPLTDMEQQVAVAWLVFSILLMDGLFIFVGLIKKLKFLRVNRGFSARAKWDLPVPESFENERTVY